MKTCIKCNIEQNDNAFHLNRNVCKLCRKLQSNQYYKNNKQILLEYGKNYYSNNKENKLKYQKLYNNNHKEEKQLYNKEYRIIHKDELSEYNKKYALKNFKVLSEYNKKHREKHKNQLIKYHARYMNMRRANDIIFKLRGNISCLIFYALKDKKNNNSCIKYLPYTIHELKDHLQNQFEPWMSWNNWGKYNSKTWDDHNTLTWFWQIDHIIPASTFKYTSMEDQEFKDCWALTNLRPYSAKQNFLDGVRKIRH